MKKSAFLIMLILCVSMASAIDIPDYQDRYVNDFAHILAADDADTLRQMFEIVEYNTTAQVVFVSVETTEGAAPQEYATAIGQKWGVGQDINDNGLIMLYVADVNKFWVATGYGLEGILPDSKVGRFLDDYYVPYKAEGNLSEGILLFSLAISKELIDNSAEITAPRAPPNKTKIIVIIIIFILIFILIARARAYAAGLPLFLPHGGGYRHSGGSSGSGGFGGGGFGGGGAGR
jgi:uncharacterized protein